MALTDNQNTAIQAIKTAFVAAMETAFPIDPTLSDAAATSIRANWAALGASFAKAVLPAICTHISTNAAIGTVTSTVSGNSASQNNAGTGLIQ